MKMMISWLFAVCMLVSGSAFANKVSQERATALALLKFVKFDARFKNRGSAVNIHVINDKGLADNLTQLRGAVPELPNYNVTQSDTTSEAVPDILVIGDVKSDANLLEYSADNRALSITRSKKWHTEGASVGILVENKKLVIKLNIEQSLKEGSNWQFDFSQLKTVNLEFSK